MNKKNKFIILPIIYLVSSALSIVPCLFLQDFQLDALSTKIVNSSQNKNDSDEKKAILNIESMTSGDTFSNLVSYYYYNPLNSNIRIQSSNDMFFGNSSLHLETQPTFSIRTIEEDGGGYYLDNGLYYTYFSDDILGARKYLNVRFDADTFIFISDSFADLLIDYYGLSKDLNSYRLLITEEEYCVLSLKTTNNDSIKFCINNIIYSSKRNGPRTRNLYGDFAIFSSTTKTKNLLSFQFEIDLKSNNYCIKKTITSLKTLGYDSSNSNICIKTYNKNINQYIINEKLTNSLQTINNNNQWYLYFLFALIILISIPLLYIINTKLPFNDKIIGLFLISFLFLLYGILTIFISLYPLFTVLPLFAFLFVLLLNRKEVISFVSSRAVRKSFYSSQKECFFFIEIKI